MASGKKPVDFLEDLQAEHPDIAPELADMAALYQRKLWHQLTLKIEAAFSSPGFNRGTIPVQLFQSFIMDFAHKINLLKLAHFAVHASKYQPSPQASMDFLESVIIKLQEMKGLKVAEPILFLRMHIAQFKLETGAMQEAKAMVESGKESLDSLSDVDPSVSAAVHYVSSLYHKGVPDFAEFYRSTLMYLSFVSSDSLPEDFKVRTAVDVSLAALLGEHVYSFGQLLQHPIVKALDGGPNEWLHEMLKAFNAGDIHQYDALCVRYAAQLNAQPALVQYERRLREKITLMALVEMASTLPAEQRSISLKDVGARTKLEADGVEFVLMKALALHLIEGSLDQVDGTVQISWVQPRILTKPQIQGLKDRLDAWVSKVAVASSTLEHESLGVVEAA